MIKITDLYFHDGLLISYDEIYDDSSPKTQIIINLSLYDSHQSTEDRKKYEFVFDDISKAQKTQNFYYHKFNIGAGNITDATTIVEKNNNIFMFSLSEGYIEIEYKKIDIRLVNDK